MLLAGKSQSHDMRHPQPPRCAQTWHMGPPAGSSLHSRARPPQPAAARCAARSRGRGDAFQVPLLAPGLLGARAPFMTPSARARFALLAPSEITPGARAFVNRRPAFSSSSSLGFSSVSDSLAAPLLIAGAHIFALAVVRCSCPCFPACHMRRWCALPLCGEQSSQQSPSIM